MVRCTPYTCQEVRSRGSRALGRRWEGLAQLEAERRVREKRGRDLLHAQAQLRGHARHHRVAGPGVKQLGRREGGAVGKSRSRRAAGGSGVGGGVKVAASLSTLARPRTTT